MLQPCHSEATECDVEVKNLPSHSRRWWHWFYMFFFVETDQESWSGGKIESYVSYLVLQEQDTRHFSPHKHVNPVHSCSRLRAWTQKAPTGRRASAAYSQSNPPRMALNSVITDLRTAACQGAMEGQRSICDPEGMLSTYLAMVNPLANGEQNPADSGQKTCTRCQSTAFELHLARWKQHSPRLHL